jgi:hypothetical protein
MSMFGVIQAFPDAWAGRCFVSENRMPPAFPQDGCDATERIADFRVVSEGVVRLD